MLKKIQERIFPFLIALSALSVSASAAFYSVSGLSKLFAGASLAVIIMASSLEVAKLVIASLLYQYRKTLPRSLKIYLTIAAAILVLITSMGIYGFLSSAFQETATKAGNIDAQISLIETKRDNVEEQLTTYTAEKQGLDEAIADLRNGLSTNTIQYKDRETGQIITTTSSSTRRALERQLDQAMTRQTALNERIDGLNEQLFQYETEIVETKTGNDLAGELGPLKYVAGLTGLPMDRIINYLLLAIIFVFDPLAIALVVAANFAFERLRSSKPKTPKEQQRELIVDMVKADEEDGLYDDAMWTEEEMQDFNNQFNADDLIQEEEDEEIEESEEWEEEIPMYFPYELEPQIEEEDDGEVEEEEYDEFDLNKDGIIDENESAIQNEVERIRQLNLSSYRKNQMIEKVMPKRSNDDLTITY